MASNDQVAHSGIVACKGWKKLWKENKVKEALNYSNVQAKLVHWGLIMLWGRKFHR